ncbi:MAG TPA: lysylphosphatidylglycerol synthase domain-containing protein [Polyangia bacterium]|nr:lysylphosphatidylglycerol synthase domain-containing protein [Polyangia bacterium]
MNGLEVAVLVAGASVYRLVPITLNALAWQQLLPSARRPRFRALLVLRWIGEAVNSLIPWVQVGGDVVRARLLSRRGIPAPDAAAVMVVDLVLGVLTQLLYTTAALVAGPARGTPTTRRELLAVAAIATGVLLLAAGPVLAHTLATGAGARRWPGLARRIAAFHAAFRALAVDRRNLVGCSAWHLGAWLSQAGETWLVLKGCGAPVTLTGALWVDSLTAAARTLAFFMPAGIGAQELALLALGRSLGLAPGALMILALVKRLRELAIGGLGFGAWVLVKRAGGREEAS